MAQARIISEPQLSAISLDEVIIQLAPEPDNLVPLQSNGEEIEANTLPPTWCGFSSQRLSEVVNYAKKSGLGFIAATTTLPNSIYSFVFPSNSQPWQISATWWNNHSSFIQFLSIGNGLVNLLVGTLIRFDYFPKSFAKLKNMWKEGCQSRGQAAIRAVVIILSIAAAVAAGALAYDAFLFGDLPTALFAALSNALVTICFRVVSMSSLIKKVIDYFDKDSQLQNECITMMQQLAKENPEQFQQLFGEKIWDETSLRQALLGFLNHMTLLELPRAESKMNKVKKYLGNGFDVSLGIAWGLAFTVFFAQKGYDGIRIGCNLIDENCDIEQLNYMSKLAIAFLPGISSTAFGYVAGTEFRSLVLKLFEDIKSHPKHIFLAMLVAATSAIGATSMTSATQAILLSENLFGLTPENFQGMAFVILNTMMAVGFDFSTCSKLLVLHEKEMHTLAKVKNGMDLINYLQNNSLPQETLKAMKQHSFFAHIHHEKIPLNENNDQQLLNYSTLNH